MYSRKNLARIISLILCLILAFPTSVFAGQAVSDYSNHWAGKQIQSFVDKGFISLNNGASFRPNDPITRADFAAIANKAFGFTEIAAEAFNDVKLGDAYYNDMLIAKKAGYMTGTPDGKVLPKSYMTRQEYAAIISRLLKLDTKKYGDLAGKFTDTASIPTWSKGAVGAVASFKYMEGEPGNKFNPKGNITRGQAVAVLDKCYRENSKIAYNKPGTYSAKTVEGNVAINVPDVTLENTTITGNLIIGEGVGNGNVKLKNVVVKGDTIVRGGGLNSIIIEDSQITNIIIIKVDNKVRVVAVGRTTVNNVDMQSGGKLEEQGTSGGGFGYVTIAESVDPNEPIILKGNFASVQVQADGVNLNVESGSIAQLDVAQSAGNTQINLGAGTSVTNMLVNAAALVTGTGTIGTAQVNAQGTTITAPTTTTNTPAGVTVAKTIVTPTAAPTPAPARPSGGSNGGSGGSDGHDDGPINVPTNIVSASVTGIVAPARGLMPIAAGALTAGSSGYSISSLTWENGDGTSASLTGGNFNASSVYRAKIILRSSTGYKFQTAGFIPIVNAGTACTGVVTGGDVSGNILTFTATFPATEPESIVITTVEATCPAPTIGEAGSNAAVAGAANYTHISTVWSGKAGANYAAAETPVAVITLTAKTGYTCTGLSATDITVAGGSVSYGTGQGVQSGGANVILTVTYPQLAATQLTISAPTLTTAKIYDGKATAAVTAGTLSGIEGSDDVTVSAVASYTDANAGIGKMITVVYTLGGANAAKYAKPVNYTVGTGVIEAKQLTISGTTVTAIKAYDGNTNATVTSTGTLAGIVGDEDVTVSAVAAYANAKVETGKAITVIYALDGADIANYVKPVNKTDLTADITAIQLAISGTTVVESKPYDGSTTAAVTAAGTLSGKIDGDDVSAAAIATYDSASVGTVNRITVAYTLSGTTAGNYLTPASYTIETVEITNARLLSAIFNNGFYGDPSDDTLTLAFTGDIANVGAALDYSVKVSDTGAFDESDASVYTFIPDTDYSVSDGAEKSVNITFTVNGYKKYAMRLVYFRVEVQNNLSLIPNIDALYKAADTGEVSAGF